MNSGFVWYPGCSGFLVMIYGRKVAFPVNYQGSRGMGGWSEVT